MWLWLWRMVTRDRWQVHMQHVTHDTWRILIILLFCARFLVLVLWYYRHYPHISRDSVSPVCALFWYNLETPWYCIVGSGSAGAVSQNPANSVVCQIIVLCVMELLVFCKALKSLIGSWLIGVFCVMHYSATYISQQSVFCSADCW